jgi:hypothetical protein
VKINPKEFGAILRTTIRKKAATLRWSSSASRMQGEDPLARMMVAGRNQRGVQRAVPDISHVAGEQRPGVVPIGAVVVESLSNGAVGIILDAIRSHDGEVAVGAIDGG